MQSLSVAKKLLPGVFFLLLAVSAPMPPCIAVTVEEIYDDDTGEGFRDGTDLTQAEKDLISPSGNDAETLGEARTKAFEYASSLLENTLTNTSTIRISTEFVIFPNQKDPNNPGECLINPGTTTIATAGPTGHGYPDGRLDEGNTNNPGLGTAYPYALFEALSGLEFNNQEADIRIRFSKCIPFYYGFTGSAPANQIDFVQIALHEIMHGIGFLSYLRSDGDFLTRTITIYSTVNGITTTREATIKSRTIYDEQLYSETDDDLLTDLTNSERAAAITSGTGLLWEGTDDGRNSCSYGQRMAELKTSSAKSQDGKPRLYAPSTYGRSESVIHTHANAEDIMEAFYPFPRNMDLTLGMLKDMGWSISADGFPPDCEPTGIEVTPEAGLVTTEPGGVAEFEVKLESKPTENVVISVTSLDESEGVTDPNPLDLTFTISNWDNPQEVTVTGVDDSLQDGSQGYEVELKADSGDRFYAVLAPKLVSLRNEDNDPVPELFIEDADTEESESTMNFTVNLTDTTADTVTAQYTIASGTAQEGTDYVAAPQNGTVTLNPGEKETTISIPVIDDNLEEFGDETLTVTLSNPQNATLAQNGATATGTIRDNDEATLYIDDTSVSEGASSMNFTVRLSPQSVRTVTAQYTVTGDEAQEGTDYEAASSSGTVTFAPEESRNTINVSLIDDSEQEANETFTISLYNAQNAVFAQNSDTATGTIRDNDQPPPPPVDNQATDEGEGGGGCTIAPGKGADHRGSPLLNLLLVGFSAFSAFRLKSRV